MRPDGAPQPDARVAAARLTRQALGLMKRESLRTTARTGPDGRFRLDVEFSDGVLAPGRDGPQIRMFESQSTFFVRVGETVPVASGVDPVTGETVEAEVTLEEAR